MALILHTKTEGGILSLSIGCSQCGALAPPTRQTVTDVHPVNEATIGAAVMAARCAGWGARRTSGFPDFYCGRCVGEFAPECDHIGDQDQPAVIAQHAKQFGIL